MKPVAGAHVPRPASPTQRSAPPLAGRSIPPCSHRESVSSMSKKLTHGDYTVGWICPLEVEQIAALEMLDEEHERLPQASSDHNVYNLGSIAGHNVVIAGLHQ